ncbi:glycosyl hydrolase family 28-related protein [Paenibacillus oceani]|uniref:Rhamnogalacturonase A/B/Epimerase-like pectate lyase domain-containing protein n=1 Tax=Paenibacillus oceani TaxID=2772510 RepID=A0A927GYL4_9BACL|nr:glycosyl hydrolase family 28-related protein [Paenibacillus oceani]MBD2862036.1 hypothetical protein [Paenibacillus oceani]
MSKQAVKISRRKMLSALGMAGVAGVAGVSLRAAESHGQSVTSLVYGNPGGGEPNPGHVVTLTLEQLRSRTNVSPELVYLVRYNGHEGIFVCDPADTVSVDNTATVIVTASGMRLKRLYEGALNAAWFGAEGNGTTDDTAAIRSALFTIRDNGGGKLVIPQGTYIISGTLNVYSNTILEGDGEATVLLAKVGQEGFSFMLLGYTGLFTCKHAQIRNLVLDGNIQNRPDIRRGNGCLFLGNEAQYNLVENVTIRNFGNNDRSGNFYTIEATEQDTGDCHSNVIRKCRFDDPSRMSGFAVRYFTNYTNVNLADHQFTKFVRNNLVEDCVFEGFTFNVIELAGPATLYNTIRQCTIHDTNAVTCIESDKGGSYNRFENNDIMKMSGPLEGVKVDSETPQTIAMRAQGVIYTGMNHAGVQVTIERYARGNLFIGNKIRNVPKGKSSSGGLLLSRAIDTTAVGNDFQSIVSENLTDIHSCIMLDAYVERATITGGTISDCNAGIITTAGTNYLYKDITISNLSSKTKGTFYRSYTGGNKKGFTLIGNQVEIETTNVSAIDLTEEDMLITGNRLSGAGGWGFGVMVRPNSKPTIAGNRISGFTSTVRPLPGSAFSRSVVADNTALNLTGSPVDPIQTTKSAMPTTGSWVRNDIVYNQNPVLLGTAPDEYFVSCWVRLTTGAEHTDGTDWAEQRVYVQTLPNSESRGQVLPVKQITGSAYTASLNDYQMEVDATAGPSVIQLPKASEHPGRTFLIIKASPGRNKVTVEAVENDTVGGTRSMKLQSRNESVTLTSNGVNRWHVQSRYSPDDDEDDD